LHLDVKILSFFGSENVAKSWAIFTQSFGHPACKFHSTPEVVDLYGSPPVDFTIKLFTAVIVAVL